MKKLVTIMFMALLAGCAGPKNAATNSPSYNGTWIPVREEIGGTVLPEASFTSQKLVIDGNNYTFTAESVDKGTIEYNGDKMDIYGKEGVNTGKHFTAIYKYENEQLTICYNLKGDSYPVSYDTKGKAGFFCCVFRKQ